MRPFDNVIYVHHIRRSEAGYPADGHDPDRNDNIRDGFRRLSKTQNERHSEVSDERTSLNAHVILLSVCAPLRAARE